MKHIKFYLFVSHSFLLFLLNIANANAYAVSFPDTLQKGNDKFKTFQFETFEMEGHVLPYRFHQPEMENDGKKYPLVVFFHGAGERGNDNQTQFKRFDPFPFWLTNPCYIVAPQCPGPEEFDEKGNSVWVDTHFGGISHCMKESPTWPMQLSIELIKQIIDTKNVDDSRVYVTGLSMGGYATWEILQREGHLFAAAIPICGGGDVNHVDKMLSTSLWVFHGTDDRTVPVERSLNMVNAIRESGGKPKYTEYPGVDHDSWSRTYRNPEIWEWMFSQIKKEKKCRIRAYRNK
jgi:predicted peptidase